MKNKSIFLIPLAIIVIVIYGAAYSVDETEQVVVTQNRWLSHSLAELWVSPKQIRV
jgi:regulator of protease activity HflC (stomatin/prohibitin superfamily)